MPGPNQNTSRSQRKTWRRRLLLWGTPVVLLFAVGLIVGRNRTVPPPSPPPVAASIPSQSGRDVILYFASVDGQSLSAETRRISECQPDEECLRETIEALIAGPQGDLAPILPTQLELRDVSVEGSIARVDFSQQLIAAHPGGTQSELLTIYGLADTLSVNFSHLRQMQILVDGATITTLKGHVDLHLPINPDFSLVQEGMAPIGKMTNLPVGRDE